MNDIKIYVIGTGGVGGYFGGVLAKAGNDVTFVARSDHYEAITKNGLVIKSVAGDFDIKPAKVIKDPTDIISPDLILFTTKTYQTEEAAKQLASIVLPKTIIITFQNGIDNDYQIRKFIPVGKVYPGIAYIISTKISPGIISQTGGPRKLIFGDRSNPNNQELKKIADLMTQSGVDAILSDNITRDLWKKFLFIVPFAGLTARYRKTIGEILSNPNLRPVYEQCLDEVVGVARGIGVELGDDIFNSIMTLSDNFAPSSKSSLLIDIENGRPTEIEALHGALLRLAHENGVPVPVNEQIYSEIKPATK